MRELLICWKNCKIITRILITNYTNLKSDCKELINSCINREASEKLSSAVERKWTRLKRRVYATNFLPSVLFILYLPYLLYIPSILYLLYTWCVQNTLPKFVPPYSLINVNLLFRFIKQANSSTWRIFSGYLNTYVYPKTGWHFTFYTLFYQRFFRWFPLTHWRLLWTLFLRQIVVYPMSHKNRWAGLATFFTC